MFENEECLPKYKRDLVAKMKVLRAEVSKLRLPNGHCRLEVSRQEVFEDSYRMVSVEMSFIVQEIKDFKQFPFKLTFKSAQTFLLKKGIVLSFRRIFFNILIDFLKLQEKLCVFNFDYFNL